MEPPDDAVPDEAGDFDVDSSEGSGAGQENEEAQSVEADGSDNIREIAQRLAKRIAELEVINPEVLRVTPAFQAFRQCAAGLRAGDGDLYHKSYMSDKISTFWSHSWHGGHWRKILTLITLYNGTPAVFSRLLTGVTMSLLFSFEQLPGLERAYQDHRVQWSTWSLCSGVVVASLVAIFWRSRSQVFLDRLCISQTDDDMKMMAIFSLAGLLKNTDKMLIHTQLGQRDFGVCLSWRPSCTARRLKKKN